MNINPKTIRFFIKNVNDQFAIIAKYQGLEITVCKGALPYCKAQFINIVNNRSLLVSVVQKAMAS